MDIRRYREQPRSLACRSKRAIHKTFWIIYSKIMQLCRDISSGRAMPSPVLHTRDYFCKNHVESSQIRRRTEEKASDDYIVPLLSKNEHGSNKYARERASLGKKFVVNVKSSYSRVFFDRSYICLERFSMQEVLCNQRDCKFEQLFENFKLNYTCEIFSLHFKWLSQHFCYIFYKLFAIYFKNDYSKKPINPF